MNINFSINRLILLKTTLFLLFLMMYFPRTSAALYRDYSDNVKVHGRVVDADKNPIVGANVIIKGTSEGTTADINGEFNINSPKNSVLLISYIGLSSKEILATEKYVEIILEEDAYALNQVVVTGYGVQKKKDLTGAVAIVDKEVFKNKSPTTLAEALQGAAAGVSVVGGSRPGEVASIEIRGVNSLTNNSPLYVIDGLVTDGGRDLNVADVESIQILKDASSAAIYGSRAANGVILVTTKKGKDGPLRIDASYKFNIQTTPMYDLADRNEFIAINDMVYTNANLPTQQHREDINTDWQEAVFKTGYIHDTNITLSGGSSNGNYMISMNSFDHKGTVIGTDFNRVSFRVNTSAKRGILKVGENLSFSNSRSEEGPAINPYWEVLRMLPTIPVYDEANPGGFGYGDGIQAKTFGSNPVAVNALDKRTNENFRLRGNVFAELNFQENLVYRVSFGYETSFDNYRHLRETGNWTFNQPIEPSKYSENRARYQSQIIENTLTFSDNIKKHNITAMLGTTFQKENYRIMGGSKGDVLQNSIGDYFTELDAASLNPAIFGSGQEVALLSYFGRVNYAFDDRYLFTATLRADGSSKFNENNRWGVFPSISAGWRISQESFFDVSWIDDLKIRANYGTLGNVNIGSYDYLSTINYYNPTIFNDILVPGATQVQLANYNLKWETLTQSNFGVDILSFGSRLLASAEYYIADSRDLLYPMPIPGSTGNDGGSPVVNAASLRNTGFEFTVNWRDKVNQLNYYVGLNLTTTKNKILNLGYGSTSVVTATTTSKVGYSLGVWNLIKTDGLFQNKEDVLNHKNSEGKVIQPNAHPGDVRYVDVNDDGIINSNDRQVLGSPWSMVDMNLNFGFSWKGVDLNMLWTTSLGSKIFNSPRHLTDRFDDNSNYRSGIKPWQKEGDQGTPRAIYAATENSLLETDRWLEDGSFLRLKDFSIGYTIPRVFTDKLSISALRVNFTAQNLLTFTRYTGLDPEFRNSSLYERGRDVGSFPNVLTLSIGLNLQF